MEAKKNRKYFRSLLTKLTPVVIGGVHDALSAKIAQRAGFQALWISSFGLAASRGIPDADILTLSETVDEVRKIVEQVDVPVIIDGNSGFGNITAIDRMVHAFEATGATGVCIEDNPYPKRCSFYNKQSVRLVEAKEHAAKISAAVNRRKDKNFFIIARTEAFICGLGLQEALDRANTYADAGADAILIHSKNETPSELFAFAKHWKKAIPLVSIPTKYIHTTSVSELYKNGYTMIIFANQTLRASVTAMSTLLTYIKNVPGNF